MNGWVVLLWAGVCALVLVVIGIFAALVVMGRITLFPASDGGQAPRPQETGVVDTGYSVMILNATPEEGLDEQMRDVLINAGWAADVVFAVDGSREDFAETTVYHVAEEDEDAALGLAHLIGGARTELSEVYADLNDTDGGQLVVVIGLDRTAQAQQGDAGEE